MIVITAPTGNIGHHVVRDLLSRGEALRLVVRDPAKLRPEVQGRVEVIEGSHGDASTIDRALNGADALFWLAPPDPRRTLEEAYVGFTRPAADAIRRHGVGRVVSITALGRGTEWENKAGHVTASIRMDDLLMETGAAFRGLAMPSFMDNALQQIGPIRSQGLMFGPIDGDLKTPTTATRDMGAAATELLADASWTGQEEVPLLGPEDLSMHDIAATISDVLGREVRYQQIPWNAFAERMASRGMSDSFVQGYVAMFRAKDEGMDVEAARMTTSRTPTSFRQWCEEELRPAVQD